MVGNWLEMASSLTVSYGLSSHYFYTLYMKYQYTRTSLLYPVMVLIGTGILLLSIPNLVFTLLGSEITYPTEIVNLVGMFCIGLGSLVALIYYYRVQQLYIWTLFIRLMFVCILVYLFIQYSNLFFLSVLGILVLGMLLTIIGLFIDQKQSKELWWKQQYT